MPGHSVGSEASVGTIVSSNFGVDGYAGQRAMRIERVADAPLETFGSRSSWLNILSAAAQNSLLANLEPYAAAQLFGRARIVTLQPSVSLLDAGTEVTYAYFPLNAVCALVSSFEDGRCVEMGMIGPEGMIGAGALFGCRTNRQRVSIQIRGNALRVPISAVMELFEADVEFRSRILSFVHQLFDQVAQAVACNRTHLLNRRLCRWLLTLHDRIGVREVDITHEAIGQTLGANRSDITRAIAPLRTSRVVTMQRGKLVICDRHELLRRSCECYTAVHHDFL